MAFPAALPPDLLTLLAALFLLFGVPAILFGLIMLYTGYVRYDGEQYLEELEATADGALRPPEPSEGDDELERSGSTASGGELGPTVSEDEDSPSP